MKLFDKLVDSCKDEWIQYTNHEFGSELAKGTLNYESFINYLIQDYIYLIHYTRCYAMLAYKARTQEEMSFALDNAVEIRDVEMAMHESFKELNINLENIDEHVTCTAYTRYLLDVAVKGDYVDLLVALTPCFVGYGEIGRWIRDNKDLKNNPFTNWVNQYGGDHYIKACRAYIDILNSYEDEITDKRLERLKIVFKDVTKLEIEFFNIALEEIE